MLGVLTAPSGKSILKFSECNSMSLPSIRLPAVAGRFYPSLPEELVEMITSFAKAFSPPRRVFQNAIACLAPHAGYTYSGSVAYAVYSSLPACQTFVVLGPNHFGRGHPLATLDWNWETPLGIVSVDKEFSASLLREMEEMAVDSQAHASEHSLEVQLPFLQHISKDFLFVPVAIGDTSYPVLEKLGRTLARLIQTSPRRTLLVASSDMNHYEPDDVTREKDWKAIETILSLDPRALVEVLDREQISMCGYAPAIAMLIAARELGAVKGELVKYATSADAGGDPSAVVGYAGIVIE